MSKVIDFAHGLTFHVASPKSVFLKELKKIFAELNVPYAHTCCAANIDADELPVSFNTTTGELVYNTGLAKVAITDTTPTITASAINATATATAAQVKTGLITSTSPAAVSITLPTATLLATALSAQRGTKFYLSVDNGVGANAVTLVVGTGTTASSAITGGTNLVVASGTVGQFLFYFQSGTTAKLARIA